MQVKQNVKKFEVYYVDLGKGTGSVQGGLRPCVIISNDIGNYHSSIIMVAPITSKIKHNLPTHVKVGVKDGLKTSSTILLEQITTVSKDQLQQYQCNLIHRADEIDKKIVISFGINQ